MEYNTSRRHLIIPEYGRHVQQMVDYCKSLESKDDRNQFAEVIIDVMGNINPHLKKVPDFKHKLWDQLFIMAEHDLDVDSPFPILTEEELNERPEKLPYPKPIRKYRYYGNVLQRMIKEVKDWEKGEKKEAISVSIANQMKKSFLMWNKDQVDRKVIENHLKDLSENKMELLEEDNLSEFKDIKPKKTNNTKNYKGKRKNTKNYRKK